MALNAGCWPLVDEQRMFLLYVYATLVAVVYHICDSLVTAHWLLPISMQAMSSTFLFL